MSDNKVVSHEEVIGSKGASIQNNSDRPQGLAGPSCGSFCGRLTAGARREEARCSPWNGAISSR
jgi:hypothetical protein